MANSDGPGLPGGPTVPDGPGPSAREVEGIFRREYGRAVSVLVRVFGDIDIAEDAVQDAFTVAVQRWPADGLPASPARRLISKAPNPGRRRTARRASPSA